MLKLYKGFKKISESEIIEIQNLYNSGLLIKDIANKLNRNRTSIRKYLDITIGKKREQNYRKLLPLDVKNKIIELNKTLSVEKISKELNISTSKIYTFLKTIDKVTHNKYDIDKVYFERIDTPNKAYFLGLLYADGNVSKDKNSIKLTLKLSDIEILKKFKEELKTNKPIYIDKPKIITNTKYISSGSATLTFCSKQTKTDLIKLGCVPNKSLILKFPTEEQVPQELIWHFIRGYFDGDGCIGKINKNKLCVLQFTGTFEFLESLQKILCLHNIDLKLSKEKRRESNVFYLTSYHRDVNLKFFDILYQNAEIYLYRKFNIFKNWKSLPYDKRKSKKTTR